MLLLEVLSGCCSILACDALTLTIELSRIVIINVLALLCLATLIRAIIHITTSTSTVVAIPITFHEASILLISGVSTTITRLLLMESTFVATMTATITPTVEEVSAAATSTASKILTAIVSVVVTSTVATTPTIVLVATTLAHSRLFSVQLMMVMVARAIERVLLSVLLLLGILDLLELCHKVVARLISEVLMMSPLKPLIMLILDMLDDKLGGTKSLITDSARIFLALSDLFCLVKAVLSLHFHEEFILLRVLNLLLWSALQKLFCLLDVILLKQLG